MERAAAARVATAERRLFDNHDALIDRLALAAAKADLASAREAVTWLSNSRDWRLLLRALHDSTNAFSRDVAVILREAEADAVRRATVDAPALISRMTGTPVGQLEGSFGAVPVTATGDLVAAMVTRSSPLMGLEGITPQMQKRMARALIDGIAHGRHPKVIARQMRDATKMPLQRALTISRTETLRAYRSSTLAEYQRSTVVNGWVWYCEGGPRTCAACYAMSGTVHELDEPMGSHPNCRCTQLPKIIGTTGLLTEDGYPLSGEARFGLLDEDTKLQILGPGKYQALQRGEITLPRLVRTTRTKAWGDTRTVASLAAARVA